MSDELAIDPRRTALLVMDYQVDILANWAAEQQTLLERAASVLAAAREASVLTVYVVVGFRPGFPEVSARNRIFGRLKSGGPSFTGPSAEVHQAVAPREGDVTVVKHRVGPFLGTDLDMVLRANDVETLVVMGVATSGVVLSAVRYAADADYRIVVVEDCCSDRDPEVHRVLVEKVFQRQAEVVTAADVIGALAAHRGTE